MRALRRFRRRPERLGWVEDRVSAIPTAFEYARQAMRAQGYDEAAVNESVVACGLERPSVWGDVTAHLSRTLQQRLDQVITSEAGAAPAIPAAADPVSARYRLLLHRHLGDDAWAALLQDAVAEWVAAAVLELMRSSQLPAAHTGRPVRSKRRRPTTAPV